MPVGRVESAQKLNEVLKFGIAQQRVKIFFGLYNQPTKPLFDLSLCCKNIHTQI